MNINQDQKNVNCLLQKVARGLEMRGSFVQLAISAYPAEPHLFSQSPAYLRNPSVDEKEENEVG